MTAITDPVDQVRLEIGDTDVGSAIFTDDEITYFITAHPSSIYLAAAAACDSLARRYARAYDFTTDGQAFSRSQMSRQYAQLSMELRTRVTGVAVDPTRRIDGYSNDIDYDETAAGSNRRGRVIAGWYDPDLPF